MSAHLAIGAAAALAALTAISRRIGSAAISTRDQVAGVSPSRREELDEIARNYRTMLEQRKEWDAPLSGTNVEFARMERERTGKPIEYVSGGRDRSVFRVEDGALKLEHHRGPGVFNLSEEEVWRRAPPYLKEYLAPVLGAACDGSWLLMEFKKIGGFLPERVVEAFSVCGIVDLKKPTNISTDGKIVDYSFTMSEANRETCLSGDYEDNLLQILKDPGRGWSPPPEWFEVRRDITTRTPRPRSGSRNEGEIQLRRESRTSSLAKEYRFRVDHNTAENTISVKAYSRKQRGKFVGGVGIIRSYRTEECEVQVRSLIGRLKGQLPDKAGHRVPMVAKSTIDDEHQGRGLGVLLYKLALQAWFDAYGPSLIVPNMCSSGRAATSTAAMRVWSSLCRELPCEHPVVAVVEPVPGLDGVDVKTVKKHKYLD